MPGPRHRYTAVEVMKWGLSSPKEALLLTLINLEDGYLLQGRLREAHGVRCAMDVAVQYCRERNHDALFEIPTDFGGLER